MTIWAGFGKPSVFGGAGAVLLLFAACSSASTDDAQTATPVQTAQETAPTPSAEPATETPLPTAEPTPTATVILPTPASADPSEWLDFVAMLDEALGRGDVDFLAARLQGTPIDCGPEDVSPKIGGPQCEYVGQHFDGIQVSSGGEPVIVPTTATLDTLTTLLRDQLPQASDEYGLGGLRVYAVSNELRLDFPRSYLMALIRRPADWGGGLGPIRVITALVWSYHGENWRITAISHDWTAVETVLDQTTPPFPPDSKLQAYP